MRCFWPILSMLTVVGLANTASAQWYVDNRASTVAEGYARGISDIVRAQGQYNLLTSQSLINIEDARTKNMQNRLQWTQTYFEMRRMNRDYRREMRGPTPSPEAFARWAREAAPERLKSVELDSITGRISWPTLLQGERYAPLRASLEQAFLERAEKHGAIGPETALKISDDANAMLQILEDQLQESRVKNNPIPSYLYIDAKKFIESLAYEARFPVS